MNAQTKTEPSIDDLIADDSIARRLAELEIPTPAGLRGLGAWELTPGRRLRLRTRGRRAMALGAVATSVAVVIAVVVAIVGGRGGGSPITVTVPGFTVEVASAADGVMPHTTREQATATARAWLAQHPMRSRQGEELTGFRVEGATFAARVLKVWEQCGAHWFFDAPENLWVVDLRAPAQQGNAYVQASVLVRDDTGAVRYADAVVGASGPPGC